MAAHPVIIDRLELYGRVWAQPLNQLAKEYGISDVALAKTCRKGNFPYPDVDIGQRLRQEEG